MPLSRITVTIPPDLVRRTDEVARRRGTSRSSVLADALHAYLAARPGPGVSLSDRVAEQAGGRYAASGAGPLSAASDAALVAELARRLGTSPVPGRESQDAPIEAPRISVDRSRLAELCRRYRIRRLSLFGSVLRDDFGPDSDVDVLVEFEPGHTPGLAMADIEDQLAALFGGRRADVVTEQSLHPLVRDQVLASAVVQYAA
jgi:predicted nucleotidyltransferase/predicted transcriptional regulator